MLNISSLLFTNNIFWIKFSLKRGLVKHVTVFFKNVKYLLNFCIRKTFFGFSTFDGSCEPLAGNQRTIDVFRLGCTGGIWVRSPQKILISYLFVYIICCRLYTKTYTLILYSTLPTYIKKKLLTPMICEHRSIYMPSLPIEVSMGLNTL